MNLGFKKYQQFLTAEEVTNLQHICLKYHRKWLTKNQEQYQSGLVNSSYITKKGILSEDERMKLFKFITSTKLNTIAQEILKTKPYFLNTQLFFNPYNENQENYWHRDIQYTEQTIDEQVKVVEANSTIVLHLRVALRDELGLEFIPTSHTRWDTDKELETRLALNGSKVSDPLPHSQKVSLKKGDLLAFDANIIHRGLYGLDRLSLDILFCHHDPEILKYADKECFPSAHQREKLENTDIFNK